MSNSTSWAPNTADKQNPRKRFYFVISVLTLTLLVSCFNACGIPATRDSSQASASAFRVSPSLVTVSSGNSVQLFALGGKQPYSYSKQSGDGTIAPSGQFIAPIILGNTSSQSSQATIKVSDANGAVAYVTVTIVSGGDQGLPGTSSALQLFASPASPKGATAVNLYAQNGTPPYTYTITQGVGSIAGSVLTVPNATQTVIIGVVDAVGLTGEYIVPCTSK